MKLPGAQSAPQRHPGSFRARREPRQPRVKPAYPRRIGHDAANRPLPPVARLAAESARPERPSHTVINACRAAARLPPRGGAASARMAAVGSAPRRRRATERRRRRPVPRRPAPRATALSAPGQHPANNAPNAAGRSNFGQVANFSARGGGRRFRSAPGRGSGGPGRRPWRGWAGAAGATAARSPPAGSRGGDTDTAVSRPGRRRQRAARPSGSPRAGRASHGAVGRPAVWTPPALRDPRLGALPLVGGCYLDQSRRVSAD